MLHLLSQRCCDDCRAAAARLSDRFPIGVAPVAKWTKTQHNEASAAKKRRDCRSSDREATHDLSSCFRYKYLPSHQGDHVRALSSCTQPAQTRHSHRGRSASESVPSSIPTLSRLPCHCAPPGRPITYVVAFSGFYAEHFAWRAILAVHPRNDPRTAVILLLLPSLSVCVRISFFTPLSESDSAPLCKCS